MRGKRVLSERNHIHLVIVIIEFIEFGVRYNIDTIFYGSLRGSKSIIKSTRTLSITIGN